MTHESKRCEGNDFAAISLSLRNYILKNFWKYEDDRIAAGITNLWHYTSVSCGVSIVSDIYKGSGLALTNYRFLNDSAEFNNGINAAIECFETYGANELGTLDLTRKVKSRLIENLQNQIAVPYVFSFSALDDSTQMWMSYCRGQGGMSLGFNYKELCCMISENMCKVMKPSRTLLLFPCIYVPKGDFDRKLLFGLFDSFYVSPFWIQMHNDKLRNEDEIVDWYVSHIVTMAALIKSDDYRFEHEWRLVLLDPNHARKSECIGEKFRLRIDENDLDLSGVLQTIRMSPHGDKNRVESICKMLALKYSSINEVQPSVSSYVG